ncbi:MAG TPA: diaminopropionate ammonia-lyase [Gemmatimonadales bacterium]|jgi:diaminopropionate ammonia-lyase|nr:diaminopropionate ammonia-lyase [Gemmatimonadales bacterium]
MLDFPAVTAMRARVNPFFLPGRVAREPRGAVRAFHRSLPGYAPTSLHACGGLARSLGLGAVWVKDESNRYGLGAFKALGAAWALHRLREHRPGSMTVCTATDGNHGRALAWAARQLGLPAVVFIPAHAAAARVESIRREGARVELVEGTYDEAVRRSAEASAARGWQVVADTGYDGYLEVPHWIAEGYGTLFEEADEQLAGAGSGAPDVVLVQAGVGGLLQAAVDHFRAGVPQPILVCVEPVEADALHASISTPDGDPVPSQGRQDSVMAGLNCGQVSLAAWPVVRRGVELFITVEDRYAEAAMRRLARPEPGDPAIVAGESGAAGLAGLLALLEAPELLSAREFLRLGAATRVLLINTEGATDPVGYRRVVGELS